MNFVIRSAKPDDVDALVQLASSVKLLNIMPDVKKLTQRVSLSGESFAQRIDPAMREYIFVAEELATGRVVGTSALYASYISEKHPMHCAHIVHDNGRQYYSRTVLSERYSGIGGFAVAREYRRHVDKVGTQLGMLRVMLFAMYPEWFSNELFVEIVAPISADEQNRFWNTYGWHFTGLRFAEAYEMARMGQRSFMESFPLRYPVVNEAGCMLPDEACIPSTARGSQHLAKKLGFHFMGSVDPMDGALQYRAQRSTMPLVNNGRWYVASVIEPDARRCVVSGGRPAHDEFAPGCNKPCLACCYSAEAGFRGGLVGACLDGGRIYLDAKILDCFGIAPGDSIFVAPYDS